MRFVRSLLCAGLLACMLGCSGSLQLLSVTAVSPATVVAGATASTLTVTGTQFNTNTRVALNGVTLPTTFVSQTVLTAQVPPTLGAGTYAVSIVENDGGFVAPAALPTSFSVQVVTAIQK